VTATPLRAALEAATRTLAAAGVSSARHDAEALAAYVLGCRRGDLVQVTKIDSAAYDPLVARRAAREPLQHIVGRAAFRHIELAVGPGVFVPRPETEVVAGWVIDVVRTLDRPVVVDLCTGSGAIALSVATEVPHAEVHAVELDRAAHDWAARNLDGSGVHLVQGDAADALPVLDGSVDAVVSNPPYIPHEAWESVEPEVRDHDPALALWADGDGLAVIDSVQRTAARLLRPGGVVAIEHSDLQGDAVVGLLAGAGSWTDVRDRVDLAGRPRFTTATRAHPATIR
jgi:release factor glutamine methyltransferase